jgi:manganese transport protein
MDPGNWATDLAGGALYNYNLLSAVLLSSILAMFLQVGASGRMSSCFGRVSAVGPRSATSDERSAMGH